MGVANLAAAFNEVSGVRFNCTRAYLSYKQAHDSEWQVIRFCGTGPDGTAFEVSSPMLRAGTDLAAAARQVAQTLLDRKEPAS